MQYHLSAVNGFWKLLWNSGWDTYLIAADFTLLCLALYAKVELIHLPCGLWTGVRECCCVSGDPEGLFMHHMSRTFCHHICEGQGRGAARIKGRDRGDDRRGEVKKGQRDTAEGTGTKILQGEDVKKLLLLGFTPWKTEILACVHETCPLRTWPIYHPVSSTFSPLLCWLICHPSFGSIEKSALAKSGLSLSFSPPPSTPSRIWNALFAKCNKWTGGVF